MRMILHHATSTAPAPMMCISLAGCRRASSAVRYRMTAAAKRLIRSRASHGDLKVFPAAARVSRACQQSFAQQRVADRAEFDRVEQLQFTALDLDQALAAKTAEHAADGFCGKTQVIGDVAARHAQPETRG